MYRLYIETATSFSPKLIDEYEDLEEAQERARKEKEADSSVYYKIEETNGGFNSYGELLTTVIEEG